MHKDVFIAVTGNSVAWTAAAAARVDWVTVAAISASVATAIYFTSKTLLLWWDRIKGNRDRKG